MQEEPNSHWNRATDALFSDRRRQHTISWALMVGWVDVDVCKDDSERKESLVLGHKYWTLGKTPNTLSGKLAPAHHLVNTFAMEKHGGSIRLWVFVRTEMLVRSEGKMNAALHSNNLHWSAHGDWLLSRTVRYGDLKHITKTMAGVVSEQSVLSLSDRAKAQN